MVRVKPAARNIGSAEFGAMMSAHPGLRMTDQRSSINVDGELDAHTASELDAVLRERYVVAAVTLDLSAVTFIDSAGLAVLLEAHRRAETDGTAFTIVKPSRCVERLLQLTGLHEHLIVEYH